MNFPIGMIALFIVAVLIYVGVGQRVLDRMRLTDRAALAIIVAIMIGSFINIPIATGQIETSINLGGAIIPVALAIYLLTKAGTTKERIRAIVATVVTAIAVYYSGFISDADPGRAGAIIDPIYIVPIIAGTVAYIAGRSRRSAFIAATLGVLALDVVNYIFLSVNNISGVVSIGGAGIFDSIVLSGILAVLLAEVVGETRERIQGGPKTEGRPKELLSALRKPEIKGKDEKKDGGEKDEK
ncbi:putative membrane protein [Desulfitispora alkaliphila]|uniref:DUF1614 domain-containing protein n=1 Tax=Desulfitispora alkaliphila TaxID=622674 RepID=UPI003D1C8C37